MENKFHLSFHLQDVSLKAVETNIFNTVKALQTNINVAKCCHGTLEAPPTALKAPTEKAVE